jgi:hypothetical protein
MSQPEPELDLLDAAETLAMACAGETFAFFQSRFFSELPHMSAAELIAASALFFIYCMPNQGRFLLAMARERGQPPERRRSPETLLADMMANGFRASPPMATRRVWAVFLAGLEEPPLSPAHEEAARLAHLKNCIRRVLDARAQTIAAKGGDPVKPRHFALLLAADAADLAAMDPDALDEVEEIAELLAALPYAAPMSEGAGFVSTPHSTLMN